MRYFLLLLLFSFNSFSAIPTKEVKKQSFVSDEICNLYSSGDRKGCAPVDLDFQQLQNISISGNTNTCVSYEFVVSETSGVCTVSGSGGGGGGTPDTDVVANPTEESSPVSFTMLAGGTGVVRGFSRSSFNIGSIDPDDMRIYGLLNTKSGGDPRLQVPLTELAFLNRVTSITLGIVGSTQTTYTLGESVAEIHSYYKPIEGFSTAFVSGNSYNVVLTLNEGDVPATETLDRLKVDDTVYSVSADTAQTIITKLQSVSGDNRLDASAIKNLPTGGGDSFVPSASNLRPVISQVVRAGDNCTAITDNSANTVTIDCSGGGGIDSTPERVSTLPTSAQEGREVYLTQTQSITEPIYPTSNNDWGELPLHSANTNPIDMKVNDERIYVLDSTGQIYVSSNLNPQLNEDWSTLLTHPILRTLPEANLRLISFDIHPRLIVLANLSVGTNFVYLASNNDPSLNAHWTHISPLAGHFVTYRANAIALNSSSIYLKETSNDRINVSSGFLVSNTWESIYNIPNIGYNVSLDVAIDDREDVSDQIWLYSDRTGANGGIYVSRDLEPMTTIETSWDHVTAHSSVSGSNVRVSANKFHIFILEPDTSKIYVSSYTKRGSNFAVGKYLRNNGKWRGPYIDGESEASEAFEPSQSNIYPPAKKIIQAGTNITVTADDTANTLTIASSGDGGGGSVDALSLVLQPQDTGDLREATSADVGRVAQIGGNVRIGKQIPGINLSVTYEHNYNPVAGQAGVTYRGVQSNYYNYRNPQQGDMVYGRNQHGFYLYSFLEGWLFPRPQPAIVIASVGSETEANHRVGAVGDVIEYNRQLHRVTAYTAATANTYAWHILNEIEALQSNNVVANPTESSPVSFTMLAGGTGVVRGFSRSSFNIGSIDPDDMRIYGLLNTKSGGDPRFQVPLTELAFLNRVTSITLGIVGSTQTTYTLGESVAEIHSYYKPIEGFSTAFVSGRSYNVVLTLNEGDVPATETLDRLKVDDTVYSVSADTDVVANPTEEERADATFTNGMINNQQGIIADNAGVFTRGSTTNSAFIDQGYRWLSFQNDGLNFFIGMLIADWDYPQGFSINSQDITIPQNIATVESSGVTYIQIPTSSFPSITNWITHFSLTDGAMLDFNVQRSNGDWLFSQAGDVPATETLDRLKVDDTIYSVSADTDDVRQSYIVDTVPTSLTNYKTGDIIAIRDPSSTDRIEDIWFVGTHTDTQRYDLTFAVFNLDANIGGTDYDGWGATNASPQNNNFIRYFYNFNLNTFNAFIAVDIKVADTTVYTHVEVNIGGVKKKFPVTRTAVGSDRYRFMTATSALLVQADIANDTQPVHFNLVRETSTGSTYFNTRSITAKVLIPFDKDNFPRLSGDLAEPNEQGIYYQNVDTTHHGARKDVDITLADIGSYGGVNFRGFARVGVNLPTGLSAGGSLSTDIPDLIAIGFSSNQDMIIVQKNNSEFSKAKAIALGNYLINIGSYPVHDRAGGNVSDYSIVSGFQLFQQNSHNGGPPLPSSVLSGTKKFNVQLFNENWISDERIIHIKGLYTSKDEKLTFRGDFQNLSGNRLPTTKESQVFYLTESFYLRMDGTTLIPSPTSTQDKYGASIITFEQISATNVGFVRDSKGSLAPDIAEIYEIRWDGSTSKVRIYVHTANHIAWLTAKHSILINDILHPLSTAQTVDGDYTYRVIEGTSPMTNPSDGDSFNIGFFNNDGRYESVLNKNQVGWYYYNDTTNKYAYIDDHLESISSTSAPGPLRYYKQGGNTNNGVAIHTTSLPDQEQFEISFTPQGIDNHIDIKINLYITGDTSSMENDAGIRMKVFRNTTQVGITRDEYLRTSNNEIREVKGSIQWDRTDKPATEDMVTYTFYANRIIEGSTSKPMHIREWSIEVIDYPPDTNFFVSENSFLEFLWSTEVPLDTTYSAREPHTSGRGILAKRQNIDLSTWNVLKSNATREYLGNLVIDGAFEETGNDFFLYTNVSQFAFAGLGDDYDNFRDFKPALRQNIVIVTRNPQGFIRWFRLSEATRTATGRYNLPADTLKYYIGPDTDIGFIDESNIHITLP